MNAQAQVCLFPDIDVVRDDDPYEPIETVKDIVLMHIGMLVLYLRRMSNPHSSKNVRIDANEWFMKPLVDKSTTPEPFSYQACCRLLPDPVDAYEFRQLLLTELDTHGFYDVVDGGKKLVKSKIRPNRTTTLLDQVIQAKLFSYDDEPVITNGILNWVESTYRERRLLN